MNVPAGGDPRKHKIFAKLKAMLLMQRKASGDEERAGVEVVGQED